MTWMICQSIPERIPWMIQTWEEWLIHESFGGCSKGAQQTEEFSWSSKRRKAEPCICGGMASLQWVVKQLGKGPWGAGGQQAQHEWCPFAVKRANSILGCINNSAASGHGGMALPLCAAEATSGVLSPVSQYKRGRTLLELVQFRARKMVKGFSCEERLSQLRIFSQEKGRLKEGILPICTSQEWEGKMKKLWSSQ